MMCDIVDNGGETENKELISVIIPAYNVKDYLARCLDSVTGQSYKRLEIMLIDDGSVDGTAELCDDYARKDKRIKVIHKRNEGVAAARNTALDSLTGDIIAFADADDYMEPDMLMKLYNAMKRHNADMSSCGYYEEYTDRTAERRKGSFEAVYDKQSAYKEFFKMGGRIGSGCWNKLIRAEVLRDIRYKSYIMGEDVEMLSRALDNCNTVVCTDYLGYHYIHRNDSATQVRFRPANMHIISVVDEMAEYIRQHHPDLLKPLYGYHAAWYVATLQCMKRSGDMNQHKKEQEQLRKGLRRNRDNYRNNPYVYRVDRILLASFMLHCFGPVQSAYELIYSLRHRT